MCGIVGIVSSKEFPVRGELLARLKKLEYRGYDSVGFATSEGLVMRGVGELSKFIVRVPAELEAKAAISHTRWATHGGVTEANAHPHSDCEGKLFIVHNGIIENYEELRKGLEKLGHCFETETDSEVIAHLLEERLKRGGMKSALMSLIREAKGTFAVLALRKGEERIYAAKRDSPLALGIAKGGFILGSDIYAFSDATDKAVFFDDDEIAVVDAKGYEFFDAAGKPVRKKVTRFKWARQEEAGHGHAHYMIKEIHEQPLAAERLIRSLETEQAKKVGKLVGMMRRAKRVVLVAAGTSYFAALLGVYFLNRQNVMAHTLIASEFENYVYVDKSTLVIAVSQSGETMDVVSALKFAKKRGAKIAAIVNVPHSTVQRMSEVSLEMMAGQEVCVAATKTFTNQVIAMLFLASKFGFHANFESLPLQIEKTIAANEGKAKALAKELKGRNDVYIIGRGISYPSAREFAHKLKEIAYVHAEGMMGGELKHGTLALVEKGTPVFSLMPAGDVDIVSNTKEVEARGGRVIRISTATDSDFSIPAENGGVFAILSVVIGQLLAYHIAKERGLPIDKPRNLAKSVTVK